MGVAPAKIIFVHGHSFSQSGPCEFIIIATKTSKQRSKRISEIKMSTRISASIDDYDLFITMISIDCKI